MTKKFRRFIPHLIVILASIVAYFFYNSRTHKENPPMQISQIEGKNSKQTQENKNCNPAQELLHGKKYANSGCLILQNGKILVISRKDKKYRKKHEETTHQNAEKPSQEKVKTAIPGGRKKQDELSPCTAQRKTFELTGIEATATKKLFTAKNGFTVFLCESKTQIPQSQKFHGSEISLIEPEKITNYKYPEQLAEIKKYLSGAK